MEHFIVILAFCLILFSLSISGRSEYIKQGSKLDVALERVQLAGNFVACIVGAVLPSLTHFLGLPLLAYLSACCHLTAVALYHVQLPPIWFIRPSTRGEHSVGVFGMRRTRWPYQTIFALGYLLMTAQLVSVSPYYW
jgi:hypothetical protein